MKRFFLLSFLYIISKIKSYKYFKSYVLRSGNILLITDNSIIVQNKDTNSQNNIYTFTNTENEEQFLNVISFAQISSNDKEYIFCRYKKNIYILYDETIQL